MLRSKAGMIRRVTLTEVIAETNDAASDVNRPLFQLLMDGAVVVIPP
jgi:hypothetical protein